MTRLNGVIFVCVATGLGAGAAASGCSSSSSSNPAAPGDDGGAEASVLPDAAAPDSAVTKVMLQWKVVSGAPPATDGGPVDSGAVSDGAVVDAGSSGDASDGAVSEAGVGDAAVDAADSAALDAGSNADDAGDATDVVNLGGLPPLSGVQVCIYQDSSFPCVSTQADGTFTMPGLPIRSDVVLSFTKSGYQSYLLPIETASTDMDGGAARIVMDLASTYVPPGVTYDATKGSVVAFAVTEGGPDGGSFVGVHDTTIALSPMSGSGPFFLDESGQIAPTTTTTFVGNTALYYNVDPGSYTLTYSNPTYDCEPISFPFGQFGIPVTTPAHSLKITVGTGYVTGIVGVLCTLSEHRRGRRGLIEQDEGRPGSAGRGRRRTPPLGVLRAGQADRPRRAPEPRAAGQTTAAGGR